MFSARTVVKVITSENVSQTHQLSTIQAHVNTLLIPGEKPTLGGMKHQRLSSKSQPNLVPNVEPLQRDLVVVCIWFVHDRGVALNGAGYAKPNGQETAWERIGLVKL